MSSITISASKPKTPLAIFGVFTLAWVIITTIGFLVSKAIAQTAYAAYDAADFDADNYDTLRSAWSTAEDTASIWQGLMLHGALAVFLLLATWVIVNAIRTQNLSKPQA
jgi:hypothetical protein